MQNSHQSQQVSRRTIAKGAAWAAPAVAMTAAIPAYAASQLKACTPAQTVTGTYANGSFNSSDYTHSMAATFGASGITANITTQRTNPDLGLVFNSGGRRGFLRANGSQVAPLHSSGTQDTNLQLPTTAASRCDSGNMIMLSQEGRLNEGQTVTFTFNQPVSSINFTIWDVDQIYSNYADAMTVNAGSAATVKMALRNGSDSKYVELAGSGTQTAVARAIPNQTDSLAHGARSDCLHPINVSICANTIAGISSFTVKYSCTVANAVWTNRKIMINQMALIGALQVTPVTCIPTTCPTPTNK